MIFLDTSAVYAWTAAIPAIKPAERLQEILNAD